MNPLRTFLVLVLLLPSTAYAQNQPDRSSIKVLLSIPDTEAFNRTMTAFVGEGLVVGRAFTSAATRFIESEPKITTSVPMPNEGMFEVRTKYLATIRAVGDTGSEVILRGEWTSSDRDYGSLSSTGRPRGVSVEGWKVLEKIATALGWTPKDTSQVVRIEYLSSGPPNSAGGVDVLLAWRNLSPTKTVKYATFLLVPYNAVNDPVASEIGRRVFANLQVVGPVAPGKESGKGIGSWTGGPLRFKNVWYNSTIVRVELKQVEIEYTDGSRITLQRDGLRNALHCVSDPAFFDVNKCRSDRAAEVK